MVAVKVCSDIYADDISFTEDLRCTWYAVDDYIVYRYTSACRKSAISEKRGDCPLLLDITSDQAVKLKC